MKTLLILILCFLNPSKIPINNYEEVIFKRSDHGFWESGNTNDIMFMSANPEIWLVYRKERLKIKAGYCKFKQSNIKALVKVIAIFPKPGFKMKQNLFTYQVRKGSKGTHWDVCDANGVSIMKGEP